jgi:hypothetical protein
MASRLNVPLVVLKTSVIAFVLHGVHEFILAWMAETVIAKLAAPVELLFHEAKH